jgi:hypothetical protein
MSYYAAGRYLDGVKDGVYLCGGRGNWVRAYPSTEVTEVRGGRYTHISVCVCVCVCVCV